MEMSGSTRAAPFAGRLSRRRPLTRALLVLAITLGVFPLAAEQAQAASAATASVDRIYGFRGQTYTYEFTVSNTSSAGERVGSIRIARPNTYDFSVSACGSAPPGWTVSLNGSDSCTFNSAIGSSDDLAAGGSATFRLTGVITAGKTTETAVAWWNVLTDTTDMFTAADGSVTATGSGNGLAADIYSVEITDIVVEATATAIGSPCPAANKKAAPGSTQILTVCGRTYANVDFNAKSLNSDATGSFLASAGTLQGNFVAPTSQIVVLARFPNATITSTVGTGLDISAYIGNAPERMSSPPATLTGYTTDTAPPGSPSTPDLVASSDSGRSSTDNVTNDNTPTFVGTAEPGSIVEIVSGTTVKGTGTADAAGNYTVTVSSPLSDGTYSLTARASDGSGNTSVASGVLEMNVDTSVPADPSFGTRPGSSGSDETPTWSFSGETNATFICKITYPDATQVVDNWCSSPKTFDIASGNDGSYTFRVSQTDVAGNTSGENTDTYVLDRQGPAAPTINTGPDDFTADPAVSWTFSGESGGTYECVLERPDGTQSVDAVCSTGKSYNLTTRPDGLYTFKVRQTDPAGHQSPYATDTFTLDRQAPGTPTITAQPPARTNDATPGWSFAGEVDGTFECVLTKPDGSQVTDSTCVSSKGYDLTADADGLYTFEVRQTDQAGNSGPYATSSFTLDRQAPVAPNITSRPANFTADDSPEWTFTGEFGASFECLLIRPNGSEVGVSPCFTPRSFDLTLEEDGSYTFKVRQIDAAGNPGPYASDVFQIDRQAPDAPSITVRPAASTNDETPVWEFSGEANATFECVLVRPDNTGSTAVSCASPRTFDLTAEPDGDYTFKVRQLDQAGNTSSYGTDDFTLDRQAPNAPTITSQPPARSNDATPEWDFSGEEGGAFQCVLVKPDGSEVTDGACAAPKAYDFSGEPDGLYTFKVRQTDEAGNTGVYTTASYTLDRQAPAAPSITSRPANATSDDTPEWTFTGEFGASYECMIVRADNSEIGRGSCTSPKTFNLAPEADGGYTFKVRQTDLAGNEGPYETDDFKLDRVAPAAPSIDSRPADNVSNPVVQWTFSGESTASSECLVVRPNGTEITDASCTSPKSVDLSSESDGTYTFKVRQTDEAGLKSSYTSDTFTLDRVAPAAPTITAAPPAHSNDATPEWDFTGEPGGSFECVLVRPGGEEISASNCAAPKSYNLAGNIDGLYTFKVRQIDAAGTAGPFATSSYTLDRLSPVAPVIGTRPNNSTNDSDPVWTFTGELGASYECALILTDGTERIDAPCVSPTSFSLNEDPDGNYTFKVRQTDLAGNTGPYATDDFILDRVAPDPPVITSRPPNFTNDATPRWTFTGDGNPPFECQLTYPDGTVVDRQPCSSPDTWDLSALPDGTYTYNVRQLDDAGNKSVYTTDAFTLDRVAPLAPAITSQPPDWTNDPTPTWGFTGEFAAVYECVLVRPDGTESRSSCTSPKEYALGAEPDGLYTFKVRQTDRAGNTGPFATDTFTLDRQVPVAPSITGRPANATPDEDPEWTFTGESGASFECVLVRPDGSEVSTYPCTSPASFPMADEVDGDYTFKVRQIDAAGNPGPYETDTFTLDRVVPEAPALEDRPVDDVNFDTVAWTFSGEPNAVYECVLVSPDMTEVVDASCSSPKSIDLSDHEDGAYTFKVRQTDEAGLTSPYTTDTFTFDRRAPSAPTITSQPADRTNNQMPEWTFSGEAGGTYECVLVRADNSERVASPCPSPKVYSMTQELDGSYTFKVRQTDAAGNVGPYAADDFVLDRARPLAPSFTSLPPNTTANSSPKWSYTGEADAVFECVLVKPDGSQITAVPCPSPKTFDLSAGQDGAYTFKVRQIDVAGNRSSYATDGFTLDRSAPTSLMILSEPPAETNDATPEWDFQGEPGGTFECALVRPNGVQTSTSNCTAPKSYDLRNLADGIYTFRVRQTDSAFNRTDWVESSFELDRQPPTAPAITDRPAETTPDDTPTWTFSGETGASFVCVLLRANGSEVISGSCSSPNSFSLETEDDGTYTFKVRQFDAAGNPGPNETDTFTLDTTPPAAPAFTSEPDADTSDPVAHWAFDGEDGGSYECVLVKPGNVEVSQSNCTSPNDFDFTAEDDGRYTFMVRQTDNVGNQGPYSTSSFNLDRIAPDAPAITSTPEYFYDVTPEWRFAGEAGGTYECVLVRPDASEMKNEDCSSPGGFDLSDEPDGTYAFKVRQVDAAGNVGTYVTDEHLFNKTPPTPELAGGPPAITNDSTHGWTITGEPDAVFRCTLAHPDGSETAEEDCSSPYVLDLTGHDDGNYTLSVRQFIGENGSLPVAQTFELDRAIERPEVSVDPGTVGNSTSPTWTFAGEDGATFDCVLVHADGTEALDDDCLGPVQHTLADQPDGEYMLRVRQTDRAGNVSLYGSRKYQLDRSAPVAPKFTSVPKKQTKDLTPTWAFDGEDGASFTCTLATPDGEVRKDENCSEPKTFNLDRLEGKHVFKVTQTDRAGNEGTTAIDRFRLDLTKPLAKGLTVGPKRFVPSATKEIAIRFRRTEASSVTVVMMKGTRRLRVYKKPVAATRVSIDWRTVVREKVISPGRYKVLVKLKDKAGNKSRKAVTLTARAG
jgi:large repetitive protein